MAASLTGIGEKAVESELRYKLAPLNPLCFYLWKSAQRAEMKLRQAKPRSKWPARETAQLCGVSVALVNHDQLHKHAPKPIHCYFLWKKAMQAERKRITKFNKENRKEISRTRQSTLEARIKRREYQRRPDVKAKRSAKHRAWRYSDAGKKWRDEYSQREDVKQRQRERDAKKRKDPTQRLITRHRRRIKKTLLSKNAERRHSTMELLGCSPAFYKKWIAKHFKKGMTFENANLWHIDHVAPLNSFDLTDPEQQRIAFHYTNHRPEWAKLNIKKGAKIITHQPELLLDAS